MSGEAERAERAPLDQVVLAARLQAVAWRWPEVQVVNATRSTNADVSSIAGKGAPHGTVVTTDYQAAGRGRLGRRWEAPPASSLMFSVLLRPYGPIPAAGWVPLVIGVAVSEALTRVCKIPVVVKWPNDLLVQGAKLGGILVERAGTGIYVAGVGVNVNLEADELPTETATSLLLAGSELLNRENLLTAVLAHLEAWWDRWEVAGYDIERSGLREAYLKACATVGQRVQVSLPDGQVLIGTALGVGLDGALLVRPDLDLPNAPPREIRAADVVHVRPA